MGEEGVEGTCCCSDDDPRDVFSVETNKPGLFMALLPDFLALVSSTVVADRALTTSKSSSPSTICGKGLLGSKCEQLMIGPAMLFLFLPPVAVSIAVVAVAFEDEDEGRGGFAED